MSKNPKLKKRFKVLLCALVSINLLLVGIIYIYEKRTHNLQIAFSTLGWCNVNDQDRPNYWSLRAWEKCVEKIQYDADVAFFGNSITAGSNFHEHFPDIKIIEFGYPGDRVDGMTRRVSILETVTPEKVFVMGGINDLHRSSPETIQQRYENLLTSIRERLPQVRIYVQSILPVNKEKEKLYATNDVIKETNTLIKEIADKNECTYIDLYSIYIENGVLPDSVTDDGVHLKKEAYSRWAEAIWVALWAACLREFWR